MNIYAKEGDKVTVTAESIKNGYDPVEEHARKHLSIGKTYTIDSTQVHGCSTDVYLKEFPNEIFNSVSFEDLISTDLTSNDVNRMLGNTCTSNVTVSGSKEILNTSVAKAFARTGKQCTAEAIELITSEITDAYSDLSIDTITQALKNGGRGKYGRTYLLSVQEVCIWIDCYMKENPEADIDNDKYDYYRYNDEYYLNIRRVLKGKNIPSEERRMVIETNKLGNRKKQW